LPWIEIHATAHIQHVLQEADSAPSTDLLKTPANIAAQLPRGLYHLLRRVVPGAKEMVLTFQPTLEPTGSYVPLQACPAACKSGKADSSLSPAVCAGIPNAERCSPATSTCCNEGSVNQVCVAATISQLGSGIDVCCASLFPVTWWMVYPECLLGRMIRDGKCRHRIFRRTNGLLICLASCWPGAHRRTSVHMYVLAHQWTL
jgi:hypothetical protein